MAKKVARGRRPGVQKTESAILAAAGRLFTAHGYRGTSIRAVAAEAGVDAALVHHYFETKQRLYGLVTTSADEAEPLSRSAAGTRTGESLVTVFLAAWDREPSRTTLAALMRSAGSDADAERRLRALITSTITGPVAATMDGRTPMPRIRAELVGAALAGLAWMRYVLRVDPIASASPAVLGRTYGPSIAALLTMAEKKEPAAR